jgi:hypothetical protein
VLSLCLGGKVIDFLMLLANRSAHATALSHQY